MTKLETEFWPISDNSMWISYDMEKWGENFPNPEPIKDIKKRYNKANKYPMNSDTFKKEILPKIYKKTLDDVNIAVDKGMDSLVVKLTDKNDPNPRILTDTSTASRTNIHCKTVYDLFTHKFKTQGYKVTELDNTYCKFSIGWT